MTVGPTDIAAATKVSQGAKSLPLTVSVRKDKDGPVLLNRPVGKAELSELFAEVWHRTHLRQGFPDVPLDSVPVEMSPINKDQSPAYDQGLPGPLSGFAISTINPAGRKYRMEFTIRAVEQMATQLAQELIASGELRLGDDYHYELLQGISGEEADESEAHKNCGVTITTKSAPLKYLNVDLAPLLRNSKPVGPQDENLSQVFYTAAAFEGAERFARQGGNQQPAVETGCMQVGTLCSCPQTGELFVVVTEVLEAQDAQSKKLSLEFSGKTWNRMQAILRARQTQPAMQTLRFVGQAHGHPFLPLDGAPPCDACWEQKECPRHSCFVSTDDTNWSRAVFPRQPWHLCHIFGLNARGDQVNKLFGQHNGNLAERGFRIVPDFDLEAIASGQEPGTN